MFAIYVEVDLLLRQLWLTDWSIERKVRNRWLRIVSHFQFIIRAIPVMFVRVTTCLENLEMSGNLKHVREMSGILLTVREMSWKKSCHGKVSQNCSLLDGYISMQIC